MIQYEIKLEHDIELVELLQICPGSQLIIEVVIDDRKAAIQITVKNGRKDVEQGKYILEFRSLEHMYYVSQISADAVRVGVEYHAVR
jgi:hypothetical protein